MDVDPVETANDCADDPAAVRDRSRAQLNSYVAITVALLATFLGICKVKDDNIVQAMQQAEADRVDHWNFYQARNIREEVGRAELVQLQLAAVAAPAAQQAAYAAQQGQGYDPAAYPQGHVDPAHAGHAQPHGDEVAEVDDAELLDDDAEKQ